MIITASGIAHKADGKNTTTVFINERSYLGGKYKWQTSKIAKTGDSLQDRFR